MEPLTLLTRSFFFFFFFNFRAKVLLDFFFKIEWKDERTEDEAKSIFSIFHSLDESSYYSMKMIFTLYVNHAARAIQGDFN